MIKPTTFATAVLALAIISIHPPAVVAQSKPGGGDPFLNDPAMRRPPPGNALPGTPEARKAFEEHERKQREHDAWLRDPWTNPTNYKTVEDLGPREYMIKPVDAAQMLVGAESAFNGGAGAYMIYGRLQGKAKILSRRGECALVATPINAEKHYTWRICSSKAATDENILMRAAARAAVTKQTQTVQLSRFKGTLTFVGWTPTLGSECVKFKLVDLLGAPAPFAQDWMCISPNNGL